MKIASVVACLALQSLFCSAAVQAADDAAQLDAVRKSVELERAGKLPDAIGALDKNESALAASYLLNVRLGWLNYESATYPEAERCYQIASGLAPASIEALQGLTLSLLAENKFADAEAAARKVLQLDAGNFSANLRLEIALRQQSKAAGAVEILRQLLVGYPSNYYVSEEFKELQKVDAAAANTIPAAEFFDAAAKTAWQKSLDAELKGNYADAIKALTYAFKARPNSYLFSSRLGWLSYAKGDYHGAESYYARALKAAPQSIEAKLGYLGPLAALKEYSQVAAIAGQVVRADKDNYYGNLWQAFALEKQHKPKAAEPILRHLLAEYPTDVTVLNELGQVRLALEDPAAARELFALALALDPGNAVATANMPKP
jgi:tetratricopeptide (TPR) repeat protein